MKKVLFINSSLTGGGSERVMSIIANNYSKDKDYIIDMVLMYNYEKDTYVVDKSINIIRFNFDKKGKFIRTICQIVNLRKLYKKK